MRLNLCDKDHRSPAQKFEGFIVSSFPTCSGCMGSYTCPIRWLYSIFIIALISLANSFYLLVLTIANRCAPFANLSETRVSFELIGVKSVIRPVTPVFDVVNKSPT
jgi:hypothetical protein